MSPTLPWNRDGNPSAQGIFMEVCHSLDVRVTGGDGSTSGWAKEYICTGIFCIIFNSVLVC